MTRSDVVLRVAQYLIDEKDLGDGWVPYFMLYAQMTVAKQKAVIL